MKVKQINTFYKILKQTLYNEGAFKVYKEYDKYIEKINNGKSVIIEAKQFDTGYVNHPNDPGGETNYGITKQTAIDNGYKGDMKLLPLEKVIAIYYDKYWIEPGYELVFEICPNTAHKLFDMAVNMGHEQATKYFQRIICTRDDGIIGNITLAHIQAKHDKVYFDDLCLRQKAHYVYLIGKNPKFEVFKNGWFNRITSIPFIEKWDD